MSGQQRRERPDRGRRWKLYVRPWLESSFLSDLSETVRSALAVRIRSMTRPYTVMSRTSCRGRARCSSRWQLSPEACRCRGRRGPDCGGCRPRTRSTSRRRPVLNVDASRRCAEPTTVKRKRAPCNEEGCERHPRGPGGRSVKHGGVPQQCKEEGWPRQSQGAGCCMYDGGGHRCSGAIISLSHL